MNMLARSATIEGVASKSVLGASLTILSTILILTLCLSELLVYTSVETVNHLTVDPSSAATSAVKISLHATFMHLSCNDINVDIEATRGDPTVESADRVVKTPQGAGCMLRGELTVGKVGGNFHIATGTLGMQHSPLIQLTGGMVAMTNGFKGANLSHTIHHLSFGDDFPGLSNPLQNVVNIVPTDVGQYQFHIKVVPTVYKPLRRAPIYSNQYSVNEQFVRLDLLSALRSSSAPGIYFYYDFYPVSVNYEETKPGFLPFMTRICGIIGGVFTVAGVVDTLIFRIGGAVKKVE